MYYLESQNRVTEIQKIVNSVLPNNSDIEVIIYHKENLPCIITTYSDTVKDGLMSSNLNIIQTNNID